VQGSALPRLLAGLRGSASDSGTWATIKMLKMQIDPTMSMKTKGYKTNLPKKSQTLWIIVRNYANLRAIYAPMVRCKREFERSRSASLRPLRSTSLVVEAKASRGKSPAATRGNVRPQTTGEPRKGTSKMKVQAYGCHKTKGVTKNHIVLMGRETESLER